MKNLKKDILVLCGVLVFVGSAFGADVIDDPDQLIGNLNRQNIAMADGDNLMERIGGSDFVVEKRDGEYHTFFCKEITGTIIFGAYVTTDNYESNNTPGYEGWCDGRIDRNIFLEGETPDYALEIYDPDGGQFALLYSGGVLVFDDNLTFWESGMNLISGSGLIEYDGISGGIVGGLVFEGTGTLLFEHTVLTPVPEPATMTVICLGGLALVRKRRRGK